MQRRTTIGPDNVRVSFGSLKLGKLKTAYENQKSLNRLSHTTIAVSSTCWFSSALQ